jgi:hypothetical protein
MKDAQSIKELATEIRNGIKEIPHSKIASSANVSTITVHNTLAGKHLNKRVIVATLNEIKADIKKKKNLVKTIRRHL